ncbi:adenylyl-sulfate kinase [Alphaproteobacteria bacterium]|nr:adenylyl-sulfate kinase [Alphaproteobacteria bacterium]
MKLKQNLKETLRVIIVGHVDHGKSTLIGKLLSDLNQIQEEKINDIKKICKTRGLKFEWAFLLDALKTERDQGITIDTTQIFFKSDIRNYVFIDAPGHKEFLKNMVTGATSAQLAILIIDGLEGIQEQTKRHVYLLSLLGIKNVIVVINKMDLINYDQNKFADLETQIKSYLKSINIKIMAIIPVSAWNGDNIVRKKSLRWYVGNTLLEVLDQFKDKAVNHLKPLRFVVQDIYKIDEKRILVGRVESGKLKNKSEYVISPSNTKVSIKSFQIWPKSTKNEYVSGECIGLELNEKIFVEKGNVISEITKPPSLVNIFEARIFWFSNQRLHTNKKYKIKINTTDYDITFSKIKKIINIDDLTEKKNDDVQKNNVADVLIESESILCLDNFELVNNTGKFSLIDQFEVVGGGVVKSANKSDLIDSNLNINENVKSEDFFVNEIDRILKVGHRPGILWLTGLSSSGKSTIAKEVEKKLFLKGYNIFSLDGDNLRHGLNRDLNFMPESRVENIRRTAEVASLFVSAGFIVLISLISPYKRDRKKARAIRPEVFKEIFIKASIEECERRDVKGLYAKARSGKIKNFTGLTAPYEEPDKPELIIDTEKNGIIECSKLLEKFVEKEFGKK